MKIKYDLEKHITARTHRYKRATIHSESFPGLATIELNLSELCNRTCSFCPRVDPEKYPNQKKFMSLDVVESLVKQIQDSDWRGNVHLSGFGEPHSHPELLEVIKLLSTSDKIFIELTTNGDRLVDKDIAELVECFNNGLHVINVDCYDNEDQYNKRKVVLDKINATYILRKYFDQGLEKAVQNYGFTNRGGALGEIESTGECYLPFYKTMIDWNGNVILCCSDWYRQAGNFGNILSTPLTDIWNDSTINKVRSELSKGNRTGVCSKCSMNGKKVGKLSFERWRRRNENV